VPIGNTSSIQFGNASSTSAQSRRYAQPVDLEDVRTTWENIGRDDPFWGVLSWQGTEDGRWDLDEFYGLGEKDIAAFFEEARVVGAEPRREAALDFGCGVGRLSRALATRFTTVHGVDISAPMVEQAQRLVGAEFANCTFQVSTSERLPYAAGSFDLVVSNLVLQHMPPRLAQRYVGEFLRAAPRREQSQPGGPLRDERAPVAMAGGDHAPPRCAWSEGPADARNTPLEDAARHRAAWRPGRRVYRRRCGGPELA
jgi:SAM-dependent methyltransferase